MIYLSIIPIIVLYLASIYYCNKTFFEDYMYRYGFSFSRWIICFLPIVNTILWFIGFINIEYKMILMDHTMTKWEKFLFIVESLFSI